MATTGKLYHPRITVKVRVSVRVGVRVISQLKNMGW